MSDYDLEDEQESYLSVQQRKHDLDEAICKTVAKLIREQWVPVAPINSGTTEFWNEVHTILERDRDVDETPGELQEAWNGYRALAIAAGGGVDELKYIAKLAEQESARLPGAICTAITKLLGEQWVPALTDKSVTALFWDEVASIVKRSLDVETGLHSMGRVWNKHRDSYIATGEGVDERPYLRDLAEKRRLDREATEGGGWKAVVSYKN